MVLGNVNWEMGPEEIPRTPNGPKSKSRRTLLNAAAGLGIGALATALTQKSARDYLTSLVTQHQDYITIKSVSGRQEVEYRGKIFGVTYQPLEENVPYHEITVHRINARGLQGLIKHANPTFNNAEVEEISRVAEFLREYPRIRKLKQGEVINLPYNPNIAPRPIQPTDYVPVLTYIGKAQSLDGMIR